MPRITGFDVYAVDLPFRKPFAHAAAVRRASESIFLKCRTGDGTVGFGECLPREYVTGESRDDTMRLLVEKILPHLVGRDFSNLRQLWDFLAEQDGVPPAGWVAPNVPHTAAWAAVDLALLDTLGRCSGEAVASMQGQSLPEGFRYSAVISASSLSHFIRTAFLVRFFGFRQVKIKIDKDGSERVVRVARRILGAGCEIRVDVNMAWTREEAMTLMPKLAAHGVHLFEQPLHAGDVSGLSYLVRETGLGIVADESLNDAESLERLIAEKACTAVNVRISKCGGLVASLARCRRARDAGLQVQIGCQVGESSLLSAAQLHLIAAFGKETRYGEGCFGKHLLRADPATPQLTFRRGGRPPPLPTGSGLGALLDEKELSPYVVAAAKVDAKG